MINVAGRKIDFKLMLKDSVLGYVWCPFILYLYYSGVRQNLEGDTCHNLDCKAVLI